MKCKDWSIAFSPLAVFGAFLTSWFLGLDVPLFQAILLIVYPVAILVHFLVPALRSQLKLAWVAALVCLLYQLAFVIVDPTATWWCYYYGSLHPFYAILFFVAYSSSFLQVPLLLRRQLPVLAATSGAFSICMMSQLFYTDSSRCFSFWHLWT